MLGEFFNRQGPVPVRQLPGKPVAAVLDCIKAFNLAKFEIMFGWLLERGMPATVAGAWVRWDRSCCSGTFAISNGTLQGSVAGPASWNIYQDPLFTALRKMGVGCHVGVCLWPTSATPLTSSYWRQADMLTQVGAKTWQSMLLGQGEVDCQDQSLSGCAGGFSPG